METTVKGCLIREAPGIPSIDFSDCNDMVCLTKPDATKLWIWVTTMIQFAKEAKALCGQPEP